MKKYQFIYYPAIALVLLLLGNGMAAAQKVFKATRINATAAEAEALSKVFKRQTVVLLDAQSIYQYVKQSGNKSSFIIDEGDDYYWNINLQLHDLRSGDYMAQRTTKNGIITMPRQVCETYAGSLKEDTTEYVRFNIHSNKLSANIMYHGASVYIEPLKRFLPSAPENKYVIYKKGDSRPVVGFCGQNSSAEQQVQSKLVQPNPTPQASDCRRIEVATESDWEAVLEGVTSSDIIDNLNFVEPLYLAYFLATLEVKYQHEWDTPLDPYSSTDACGTGGGRLAEFQSYWQNNYSWVKRDINILYSGVDFTGSTIGCSYRGTFANSTGDYCYLTVQWITSYSDEKREVLVAHEIGHTFGCEHDTGPQCESNNGPIMCPSIGEVCADNCTPYWSVASINAIVSSMASSNGSYRLRTREFFQPINTSLLFGFVISFSGNDLYLASGNVVGNGLFGNGSLVYSGTDDVTLQPGFSASVQAGTGAFVATIGACDYTSQLQGKGQESITAKPAVAIVKNNTEVRVYPNPFNINTTIELNLEKAATVSVSVYDMQGRLMDKPVISRQLNSGNNRISYANSRLAANVYVFVIDVDGKRFTEKVVKM